MLNDGLKGLICTDANIKQGVRVYYDPIKRKVVVSQWYEDVAIANQLDFPLHEFLERVGISDTIIQERRFHHHHVATHVLFTTSHRRHAMSIALKPGQSVPVNIAFQDVNNVLAPCTSVTIASSDAAFLTVAVPPLEGAVETVDVSVVAVAPGAANLTVTGVASDGMIVAGTLEFEVAALPATQVVFTPGTPTP